MGVKMREAGRGLNGEGGEGGQRTCSGGHCRWLRWLLGEEVISGEVKSSGDLISFRFKAQKRFKANFFVDREGNY